MGLALVVKALLLVHLSQMLLSSFVVSAPIWPQASPPPRYLAVSPVMPPTPPPAHHHHPHPHPHLPTPAPTKPPTHPPKAPTPVPPKPPATAPNPPVHPPPKPPVDSPPKPPTTSLPKPPVHPPPKPPTTSPPKPPVHPPPKPPTTSPPKPTTYPTPKLPTTPPTKPPTKPPTYPPSTPSKSPTYHKPTDSHVKVQGVVYCKSCKYTGVDTLLGSKPVPGATVRLACKDTKELTVQFKTDKNGYFFLQAPNTISNFSIRKCSVSLVSPPLKSCSKPSNLNGGLKGAPLKPQNSSTSKKFPYVLYSVGPFAFEPKCH